MTAREKIDAAVTFLKSRHVAASTAAPPLWRLCWSLGLMVPPPHFLGFIPLAILTGVPFGLLMSAMMFIPFLVGEIPWDRAAVLVCLCSGPFFGLTLASYYRWSARQIGLPSWSEFHSEQEDEADAGW